MTDPQYANYSADSKLIMDKLDRFEGHFSTLFEQQDKTNQRLAVIEDRLEHGGPYGQETRARVDRIEWKSGAVGFIGGAISGATIWLKELFWR